MKRVVTATLSLIFLFSTIVSTQAASHNVVYKTIESQELHMDINVPDDAESQNPLPAVMFFHGGAWSKGSIKAFAPQAEYLCARGLVTICVQYRLDSQEGCTPAECLKDAKSALRYIKANAAQYNIDTDKIILSGGSAGGHLAAATVMCPKIYDSSDDLSITTDVAALMLLNPVICNGPDKSGAYKGWGYARVGRYYKDFSPMHNVRGELPPMLYMVGDLDNLAPVEVAEEFARLVKECGGRCDLHIYPGHKHGFFNIRKGNDARGFYLTLVEMDKFLASLGYLVGDNEVEAWLKQQNVEYIYK